MIEAPKRMTAKAVAAFEQAVRVRATEIMAKYGVSGTLRVKAVKGSLRNFASVQIINPTATAREHYALAQEFKAEGFGNAMLFGVSKGNGVEMFEMFYPLSPNAPTISKD